MAAQNSRAGPLLAAVSIFSEWPQPGPPFIDKPGTQANMTDKNTKERGENE